MCCLHGSRGSRLDTERKFPEQVKDLMRNENFSFSLKCAHSGSPSKGCLFLKQHTKAGHSSLKIFTLEDNRFQGSLTWQVTDLLGSSISQDDEPTLCFPGLYLVTAPLTWFLPGLWRLSLDFNHHLHVPEFQKCL